MSDAAEPITPVYDGRPTGWRRYVYATNHKDIGQMYLWFAILAGLVGGALSVLVRAELLEPGLQYFGNPHLFGVLVTGHGLIMIFFMVLPAMIGGFGNWLTPLLIGAPDTAFPRLNALSFWLMPFAFALLILSMFVKGDGGFNGFSGGFMLSAPLSTTGAPGPAVDFAVMALIVAAVSAILSGINFVTTILNMRCPGMTLHKMPLFVWSMLVSSFLLLLTMPVMGGAVTMLIADRHLGTAFFNPAGGGDPLLYQNLIWFFAHPAAYVLILPGFGMVSHIVQVFTRRPGFGYLPQAYAMIATGFSGFLMWANHMFTAGLNADTHAYYALAALIASIPLSVLVATQVGTLWGGSIRVRVPLLFAAAFLILFSAGTMTGVVLSNYNLAGVLGGTTYVAAHLHVALGASAVFAIFAGFYFWLPKFTGYLFNDTLAKIHFWLTFIGVNMTFLPMHILGLSGMATRHADYAGVFADWNRISSIGAFISAAGVVVFLIVLVEVFAKKRKAGDNPWGVGATTLEWTLPSPPPFRTFNDLPKIM